jgi:hypothetical protein
MKLLINKGADAKAVDLEGYGLLDQVLAVRHGVRDEDGVGDEDGERQFEILKYLHSTLGIPLKRIIASCRFNHIEYFLPFYPQYEPNILHFARDNPHYIIPDLINYIIAHNPPPSEQPKALLLQLDEFGQTPLIGFILSELRGLQIDWEKLNLTITTLIQHGSNIFHRDSAGEGVLHNICQWGDNDVDDDFLELVLQHVIDQIDVGDVLFPQ